jgi:hypothetical protein
MASLTPQSVCTELSPLEQATREIKRLTTRLLDEQLKNRSHRKYLEDNRLLADFRAKNFL